MMGLFSDPRVETLMHQVSLLENRVQELENNARYIADQPKTFVDGGFLAWQAAQNAYQNGTLVNEVPINGVVKAIVKHLGMEVEKIPEQTTKKPLEIKVVEKQPSVAITGTDGVTGTTRANVAPMPVPKPKRKYTKRKTK